MASKLFIKGKQLTGAVANALKINCKDKDGNKSTVQAELNKLNNLCEDNQNNIEERVPFNFGIDGDGNYGYYKADDSFVPFKQAASKGQTVSGVYASSASAFTSHEVTFDELKEIVGISDFTNNHPGTSAVYTLSFTGNKVTMSLYGHGTGNSTISIRAIGY